MAFCASGRINGDDDDCGWAEDGIGIMGVMLPSWSNS